MTIHFHGHTVQGRDNIVEEGIELYSDPEETTFGGELSRLYRISKSPIVGEKMLER